MNRLNTQGRRVGRLYGILLMLSYWGCIVVDAKFAPTNREALMEGLQEWFKICPEYGSSYYPQDCPDGSFADQVPNGEGSGQYDAIGDWDVSKVTDFSSSTFAPPPPRNSTCLHTH